MEVGRLLSRDLTCIEAGCAMASNPRAKHVNPVLRWHGTEVGFEARCVFYLRSLSNWEGSVAWKVRRGGDLLTNATITAFQDPTFSSVKNSNA